MRCQRMYRNKLCLFFLAAATAYFMLRLISLYFFLVISVSLIASNLMCKKQHKKPYNSNRDLIFYSLDRFWQDSCILIIDIFCYKYSKIGCASTNRGAYSRTWHTSNNLDIFSLLKLTRLLLCNKLKVDAHYRNWMLWTLEHLINGGLVVCSRIRLQKLLGCWLQRQQRMMRSRSLAPSWRFQMEGC